MNTDNMDQFVQCPKCGESIPLSEVLISNISSNLEKKYREEYDKKIKEREQKIKSDTEKALTDKYETDIQDLKSTITERDSKLKTYDDKFNEIKIKEKQLVEKELSIQEEITNQVNIKALEIEKKAKEKAAQESSLTIKEQNERIAELTNKISDFQANELELRRQKREMEDEKKEFELKKQRELDAAKDEIYQKVKLETESEHRLKLRDQEQKNEQLSKIIDQLNKKLEQGSQQLQGESQELELEDLLRQTYPMDEIIPVGKGIKGADVIQKVKNQYGYDCGTIIWESKRHKKFDSKWIEKLKEDQRAAKAQVGIIITQVLPDSITNFGIQDGIYIGGFNAVLGISCMLREQLCRIQMFRQSEVGKNQKMESLYNYLVSHEFSQRIEAIITAFETLKKQVGDERKAFEKQWAARERMLNQVIVNTSGMHGDLKGLIGASLPEIKALEMPDVEEENLLEFHEN